MEIDLAAAEVSAEVIRSQVCVVGAGIAGLVLAWTLVRRGFDVVVLEAGGRSIDAGGQRLIAAAGLRGEPHVGTRQGRFRVFGGSSLRWGGQLLAMPRDAAAWPVGAEELTPFVAEAERLMEVDALPFDADAFFADVHAARPALLAQLQGVDARVSKWMGFSRRNLAASLGRDLMVHPWARVYLHAQVTELLLAPSRARLEAVMVRTAAGACVRFEAEQVVLAAGPVESARLLLASRSVVPEGVGNAHDQVGRNFHDHVTLPVATMTGVARERVLREIRPWVFGETLHSVKLEASRGLRERLGVNPVLAHIAVEEPEGSGVAVVRELLMAVQRGDLGAAIGARAMRTSAMKIPRAALEAVRLGWEAKVRHRRFVSARALVKLQLNVAQDAPSSSRITLGEEMDAYGLPQVVVDWRVTKHELDSLRRYAKYLKGQFEAAGLMGVEWLPDLFVEDAPLPGLDDARHAMGGACMGVDPRTSVVDAEMRVHGVENLSVAGAATFPDGSPQLPTLTMMALALRLAERLAKRLI
jgi:choline dehydrogenase-like flavoprotein